jgi:hypothetical protein
VSVAQGFWRGLTDGRGLEGLLGFSPKQVIAEALERASVAEDPSSPEDDQDP